MLVGELFDLDCVSDELRSVRPSTKGSSQASSMLHGQPQKVPREGYVRFSNRPFWVKRFQTIRRFSVDVAHGLALLFGIGTKALPLWDSRMRWSNLCSGLAVRRNGRSKRTCELTSSIVPRGTSFHRSVELDVPPIAFDSARSSCRHGFPGPAELGAVHPDAVHDHSQPTR